MADTDVDLAVEAPPPAKGGGMKLVIFGLVGLILLGGAAGAVLYFTGVIGGGGEDAVAEGPGAGEEAKAEEVKGPLLYHPLEPPFVVNFTDDSDVRFMQVRLQAAARDPDVIEHIKTHSPAIRNALVMLFSGQDPAELNTREGKEKLQKAVVAEVNRVLEEQTGSGGVDNVFFTSFVMQ